MLAHSQGKVPILSASSAPTHSRRPNARLLGQVDLVHCLIVLPRQPAVLGLQVRQLCLGSRHRLQQQYE